MAVLVRPASEHDAGAIASMVGELRYGAAADDVIPRVAAIAQDPDATVLVVELDNAVVGWIHVYGVTWVQMGRFAGIGGLAVADGHRGTGIGTLLVEAAEDWARGNGYPAIRVRSNVNRDESHPFYLERGFHTEKTLVGFIKDL